ncbi:membrane protein insertase YidC [Limnohabitans sp. Bal53]|uniref:membrane protein insertase YidC n=1 Tax=Limnohabitans sp. Bal53 TaxID=1977910 RepID=UPI000D39C8CD|nr:membrane protein insertase YidC [Limnohabitans sp. Bal53]PUE43035.1 membrane protein insertase YidC [Limnohabitans sp. Bal53]
MTDIRRTILWVIFGFSLVLLWDQWQLYNGNKATFFPKPEVAATASAPAAAASANGVPATSAAVTATPGQVPTSAPAALAAPREKIEVETDVLKLSFDSEGGSLVRTEFTRHRDFVDSNKNMVLLDQSSSRVYMAQTGLIGGDFPTHKAPMSFSGERSLKDGQNELNLRFESAEMNGVKLVKTYTLKRGSYVIDVKHEVVNNGQSSVSPQLYMQLVRDGNKPEGESSFYSTFTGPAIYTDAKKYNKVDFEDIEKNKAEIDKTSTNGYVAMVQHYFASAWLLADGVPRENFVRKVDTNLYAVGMITPVADLAPGQSKTVSNQLYSGPQEEKVLEALTPGLDLVKDYGWLAMLSKPLYWLLDQLHSVLQNWGWSIVALVLLLKIGFYWLNAKAYSSMAKMKAINPRIMEMRERLKNNPQQMQQEMMKIYREEKVNPMGGCFPIMIQIPVFIALYWVLLSSVEMRNAPWIGWIHDLSAPDPFFILPLVMTSTTLLQTALNPAPPDPMQAKLMWLMPLIFSVMFFFFPAGLVLYWITNNILSIAQQWMINTRMGVPPQFNLPKFK